MTITVNTTVETVSINNVEIPLNGIFTLTSGYSKEPVILQYTRTFQNERYSTIDITFDVDFKDEHKNGIYYYNVSDLERGYVKIITEPGGRANALPYNSGETTENRESKVFYRPQY